MVVRLGSACSGVGCIDLGLERAGFEPAWQIEIDSTCRSVLERHWPDVKRHEDLTHAAKLDLPRVDLIAAGTPCQDLSVAGKGAGLDGERSSLFYDFVRLADSQPWAFVLWENVPGALSSNGGRDFAVCLEGFTGTRFEVPPDGWRGSGVATGPYRWAVWRVCDAQYHGVAQRRRRLFVVAGPRGRCGPEILLESEGVPGDPPPSREAGAGAATLTAGRVGSGRRSEDDVNLAVALTAASGRRNGQPQEAENLVITSTLASHGSGGGYRLDDRECRGNQIVLAHTLRGEGFDAGEDGTGRGTPLVVDEVQITHPENRSNPKPGDPAPSLAATSRPLAFQCHGSNVGPMGTIRAGNQGVTGGVPFVASPLTASSAKTTDTAGKHGSGPKNVVLAEQRPRRLTPPECERLQGLPDGHTRYRAKGTEIADGPRYRMVGNGAAVPVIEWIGRRLAETLS